MENIHQMTNSRTRKDTASQFAKYCLKLCLFVLVPGLHQISMNRRILGALLFCIFSISSFIYTNRPVTFDSNFNIPQVTFQYLLWIPQISSWMLMIIDMKSIGKKPVRPGYYILVASVAFLYSLNFHERHDAVFFVEQGNFACPELCVNDAIEYQQRFRSRKSLPPATTLLFPLMVTFFPNEIQNYSQQKFLQAQLEMNAKKQTISNDIYLTMFFA